MSRPALLLIATVLLALRSEALPAQTPATDERGPHLQANRLHDGDEVRLDGLLEEEVWARAVPVSDFTQRDPVEGAPPSRRTEVRVSYDAEALYLGARIFDDPEGILAYQKRRDAGLGTDDRFMWILDTFLDGRTGYFFEINAAGLMGDGIITGGGGGGRGFGGGGFGINKSWDGIWEAQVARLDDGWSAEVRIPFRTLNFDPALDTWGINFQRTIRRINEEIVWRGHRRNQNLTSPIHAGRLVGLEGLSQGIGLEARSAAVAGWRSVLEDEDPTTFPHDVSLDLGYSITPSLRASLSVNTDFAEVEVDDRRVNLTRFPLRFPERRNFFLEGSGVFSFAPSSGPSPYFSRRIGLFEGQQVPIRYGARMGGQVGRWELGFVQVSTGRHEYVTEDDGGNDVEAVLPTEDFTVARVRRSFWSQSTVGAIYTRRHTAATPEGVEALDRHTAGMDLALETSTLFGDKNAQFDAFWVWNSNPDSGESPSTSDLTARGVRFDFPNDPWSGHLSYREFGSAYDPDVGFVTRNDFRRVEPRIGWQPRPEAIEAIRSFDFSAQYTYLEDLTTGVAEEKQLLLDVLGVRMESGDDFDIQLTRLYEFLDESFEVSDGVEIQPGGYTNWEWSANLRTAGRRRLSGSFDIARGGFWNGDRTTYETRLTLRPQPGISVSWDWERNEVTLPQGDFDASVYRLGGGWDATPWVSMNGNVQYDDVSDVLGLFARLHWIVKPGNDVYLVYTHNWERLADDLLDRRFATLSRGASLKVSYTYRF